MKIVDDALNASQQLGKLLNGIVELKVFMDLRQLLESIWSSEKALRQSMAFLKLSLEDGDVKYDSWV